MTGSQRADRDRRRGVAAVLGLGLLTGLGIAGTSAAWTDDAWAVAPASAASVDLRGSTDGGATWHAADVATAPLTVDAVTGLVPDTPVTRTVQLWNASTVPVDLTWTAPDEVGCVDVEVRPAATRLEAGPTAAAAGAVTTVDVTFSVPEGTDPAGCAGTAVGPVEIVFHGSPA
ncbi:hypothetical protein [Actinotalea sp. JY-7885]|uniref:hypothetical protein n=1 Tax=Actinotalea sp. JY-7885 TaxID=2758576 RepID=UPI00165D4A1F|nr:hypothetical protein [Actinotalea sp. JY-7885]